MTARAKVVQLRNPRSDRYITIDRKHGVILAHKKSPGPFKGVPYARREPYTAIGIRRIKCSRKGCRRRGYASWQICANGRAFKPLCYLCDIAINQLVLEWMGDPHTERKMAKYAAMVITRVNAGDVG